MYYIPVSDGTHIAVEDLPAKTENQKGIIVMVHGWPISHKMFEYQQEALVSMGYRVITYDLRGFGKSQVTSTGYDYNRLAEDLYDILETLQVENIILLGFSMGGAIVCRYMRNFANKHVKKLILAGATLPSFTKTIHNPYGKTKEEVDQLIEETRRDRPHMIETFGSNVFALAHSPAFLQWFNNICEEGSGVGTIQTAISLKNEDCYDDLFHINVPTAIFHGTLDKICSYQFTKIMKENIKNATIYPFSYSGHGLFYDEKELFLQYLLSFINEK